MYFGLLLYEYIKIHNKKQKPVVEVKVQKAALELLFSTQRRDCKEPCFYVE
jgi:hypothetical protein